MSSELVTIIDYGAGNILSVQRSFEYLGNSTEVTSDPMRVSKASKVVLPGVGAFPSAMKALKNLGLDDAIKKFVQRERPLLAICLGMQLLMESSEEFGKTSGLGIFKGGVTQIPASSKKDRIKIPLVGWSEIYKHPNSDWENSILSDTDEGEAFYFVHSFRTQPTDPSEILAFTKLEDLEICAAIARGYTTGIQFHPEKSAKAGLSIIRNLGNKI